MKSQFGMFLAPAIAGSTNRESVAPRGKMSAKQRPENEITPFGIHGDIHANHSLLSGGHMRERLYQTSVARCLGNWNLQRLSIALALGLWMCSTIALAQLSGKGGIAGTVTDQTGAVIPNATVTAMNGETSISATTKTNGGGDYHFTTLDPGIYSVTVTGAGFEKLVQENIHVNATESRAYNPVLTVGRAEVEIRVSAAPPALLIRM